MERLICLLGLFSFIAIAWTVSSDRRRFPVRVVVGGLLLQVSLAFLILRTKTGQAFFDAIGEAFELVMGSVTAGSGFLFNARDTAFSESILGTFAFGVLPTVIFFSSLMSILYHLRVMQWVVWALA